MKLKIIISLLLVSCSAIAQTTHLTREMVFPMLGSGFNSIKGTLLNVVPFNDTSFVSTAISNSGNSNQDIDITNLKSKLLRKQQFDIDISVRNLAFKAELNAGISDYISDEDLSVSWYISYKNYYTTRVLRFPVLKDEAESLLKKDYVAFVNRYGNEYISSLTLGNSIVITYTYTASNGEEKKAFAGNLQASLNSLLANGKVNSNFGKTLEKASSETKLKISSRIFGVKSDVGNIAFLDLESVKTKFKEIIDNLTIKDAVCLEYITTPYPLDSEMYYGVNHNISDQYLETFLKILGEIKLANDFINSNPEKDSVNQNLRDDILTRNYYLTDLRYKANTFFNKSNSKEEVIEKEKAIIALLGTRPAKLRIPELPRILKVYWQNYEDIMYNRYSVARKLSRVPDSETIDIHIKGVVTLSDLNRNPDNSWITLDVLANGQLVSIIDLSRATYHDVDRICKISRPPNGEVTIQFGNTRGTGSVAGNSIRFNKGFQIYID